MNPTPLSNAKWLAPDIPSPSPVIVRTFTADAGESATLTVTGLGYFEARLNGKKLGDEFFSPIATDYERRRFTKITYPCHDRFTHRIFYKTFDLSGLLADGTNCLEIQIGGGWFVQNERIAEGKMSYGDRVKCIYSLTVGNRTMNSDGSETWYPGDITFSNLFIGETVDPTLPKADPRPVILLPSPMTVSDGSNTDSPTR